MRSVIIRSYGGPEVLEVVEAPEPEPDVGEVVIRAQAMAVSGPDRLIRRGEYKWAPPLPANPGNELTGTVEKVGSEVAGFSPGQKVLLSSRELPVRGGCYTELIKVPETSIHLLPESVDIEQAVVIPSYVVAYAMFHELGIAATAKTIFVTGAAGTVGGALADLARANGTSVIGSVGSDEKAEFALTRGATHTINYKNQDIVEEVMKLTNGRGVDASFDHIIGQTFLDCIHMLADFGTAVAYNVFSPLPDKDVFDELRELSPKSLAVRVFNIHTYDHRQSRLRAMTSNLIRLLEEGRISPKIGARFPLTKAAEAHRAFESGEVLGKIVLTPDN